jgi:hypothetical protein
MSISHGMDWAALLPAFRLLGSWSWLGLGAAAVVAAHVGPLPSDDAGCRSVDAMYDAPVCLGDGALLDPATSLIWRTPAPGTSCAEIDPIPAWRMPTDAEISGVRHARLPNSATQETLCVNDTLARLRPPWLFANPSNASAADTGRTMSDKKTAALRIAAAQHPLPDDFAPVTVPSAPSAASGDLAAGAGRGPGATMSPIRRWRYAPRPVSWQPGTWGDPL